MLNNFTSFINEEFYAAQILPPQMDALLADGWRHFGEHFMRYNIGFFADELYRVLPLRVRVADFNLSKSQRRVVKRNQDLQVVIRPIKITLEKEDLFERHKRRFTHSVPDSLYDFLSYSPAEIPCNASEVCLYDESDKLVAASFFDVGATAVSGVYAMFDPLETSRSLGIYTILLVIKYAVENSKNYYYPGYAYVEESFYDYKKRLSALEFFDWNGNWADFKAP